MKYALVTGSTKGIGYAIANMLIQNGYFVFMNYVHDDVVASAIKFPPDQHCVVKADLSDLEGVRILTDEILNKSARLDCLVINAGTTCRKSFTEIDYDDWRRVMDVNVSMPFFIIQRLFDIIAENGTVIFISSMLALKPHATSIPYGVSKAALNMLAQSLVKEFAGRRIRVNAICPGFIDTEWQKNKPDALRQRIEGKISLGQFGAPGDVAKACRALIENDYINGALIPVDGGYDML